MANFMETSDHIPSETIRTERLIPFRGIVGVAMRTGRSVGQALEPEWPLAIHTDGISQRFETPAITSAAGEALDEAAQTIIQGWGRQHDDATLVLAIPDSITS